MRDAVTANLILANHESDFQRFSIQEKLQDSQRPNEIIFSDTNIEKIQEEDNLYQLESFIELRLW